MTNLTGGMIVVYCQRNWGTISGSRLFALANSALTTLGNKHSLVFAKTYAKLALPLFVPEMVPTLRTI